MVNPTYFRTMCGISLSFLFGFTTQVAYATCIAPANVIEAENCLAGNAPSEWDISGAGDAGLQGFATDISVNHGQTISFKIDTTASNYKIDIYRLGYYQGNGARYITTITPTASLPQAQPACLNDANTGLVDCGNWAISAHWDVPADAVSGVYIAKLVSLSPAGMSSHMVFIVRNDASTSDLMFQTSDTTWQAYNNYGGNSLYQGSPAGRAYKVSYNRPFITRENTSEDWVFNAEYPMIRWLERNGYDVTYSTGVDSDRHGALILNHKVFMSVGHDEYWSANQRSNVESARNNGVSLAFFSGNESFWKTYLAPSIDGSNTANRTIVCYKETHDNADNDGDGVWTGTWRDTRAINLEGPYPENAMSGNIFMVNSGTATIQVPYADGKMRFWRNTLAATLGQGDILQLAADTLGYEWDVDLDNGFRPPGLFHLSTTTVSGVQLLQDQGSNYADGTATHHLTFYRDQHAPAASALVFGAGTIQWSWGLDSNHDRGNEATDVNMQQATVNLLADMGAQPATLQAGLAAAVASTDTTPPTTAIASPHNGDTLSGQVLVSGTASDSGGGVVGGVEVSTDNGATWHPASGRESWSYAFVPVSTGTVTIVARSVDDSGNLGAASTPVNVTLVPATCPCSLFSALTAGEANDPSAVQLGFRFQSDVDGYVTGIRFYKTTNNIGTHTGSLWSNDGTLLSTVTFVNESASGWQEVDFASPVQITANTTYVASYYAPNGEYANIQGGFSANVDSPPLHALADGADGANGVYHYGSDGVFPTDTYNASNYLVDVVFAEQIGPDTTPPFVATTTPADLATNVSVSSAVTAQMSEAMDASTVTGANVTLKDSLNNPVAAAVSYNPANYTITLTPNVALQYSTSYAATISTGVTDVAGNALSSAKTWSFTTQAMPPPFADEGPGGPILVITTSADPYSTYYEEILRAEGYNAFLAKDIANVNASVLNNYDVAILANMSLSPTQASMLSDWVNAGGNLIAMHPDANLAGLLGLTPQAGTLQEGYLLINNAAPPGYGIVGETIQYHGTSELWSLNTATQVAALYLDANTLANYPAVTLQSVGANGGHAAAFMYDFARSIVKTRQGNQAWAGQKRDGQIPPIRSDDMFFPDWVDFNKIAIPQADEQQRLLTNMIAFMNQEKKPLPKFWYFPRDLKAVIIMTGDDHGNGGTAGRFQHQEDISTPGCSVADWQCIRSTSYVYPSTAFTLPNANATSDANASHYVSEGFEVGVHPGSACAVFAYSDLNSDFGNVLAQFQSNFPSLPNPTTNRTHCISWPDWDMEPKIELAHGMRLDANYYYWPDVWILNRPGMFTGSGMPMRFVDTNGAMIDVYQATTQMPDESGETFPYFVDTLLDNALGSTGYYGAFTANMHTDSVDSPGSDAIISSAQSRGVPVVSAKQMLDWIDGRNASYFASIAWNGNVLSFDIVKDAKANGLRAMVPTQSVVGTLTSVSFNGNPVALSTQVIKGTEYAFFDGNAGSYQATYAVDTTPPQVTDIALDASAANGSAQITWQTNEDASSRVDFGTDPNNLIYSASDPSYVTSHTLVLTGLDPNTTYYFAVVSIDRSNNATVSPSGTPVSFMTPAASLVDTTVADFGAGSGAYVSAIDNGELMLLPTLAEEFSDGPSVPAGFTSGLWDTQNNTGSVMVASGVLTLDGGYASTSNTYASSRVLDFVATFGGAVNQHVGFTDNFNSTWILFSTKNTTDHLFARTHFGADNDVDLGAGYLNAPHDFRIEWDASEVRYYIDNALVATIDGSFAASLNVAASDFASSGPVLTVDWMHLSPYADAGIFQSRIFDAGQVVNWSQLSWTADLPTSTYMAMSVRTGNTPVPDGSWTSFVPVVNSGDAIGSSSRYLQYEADLGTSDTSVTPLISLVRASYNTTADTTLPAILTRTPLSNDTDVALDASITVGFTEAMDPGTFDATSFALMQGNTPVAAAIHVSGSSAVLTPSAPLLPYTTYTVVTAATVTDLAGNPLGTQDSFSFTTGGAAATLIDDIITDEFGQGTPSGTYLTQTDNGEVTLAPTSATEFDGSALPLGWEGGSWTGGTPTVSSGQLLINGSFANDAALYAPDVNQARFIEFKATFSAKTFENAGFAVDLNNSPFWAVFGHGNDAGVFLARTNNNGSVIDTPITDVSGSSHVFRIEWDVSEVRFYIDGALVATNAAAIAADMHGIVSDYNYDSANNTGVVVDWMRMGPYDASGTFISRIFDAGSEIVWGSLSADVTTPIGTGITFMTRSGNTASPDGSWSAFEPLGANGAIVSPQARYLQYQATLTTSNTNLTPILSKVTITGQQAPSDQAPVFSQDLQDQTSAEGDVINLSAGATDPDGNVLTYSATGLPAGLTIDTATGLISGTIDYSASTSSPYAVTITVTDGTLQAQDTFSWTVSNTDRAPVFSQDLQDQTNAEGDAINLSAGATDPDGDALTYSATGLPAGLSINATTGLISGTIDYSASTSSPHAVTITVTDGTLQAQDTFSWTVSNTDRVPVFGQDLQDRTNGEGDAINLSAGATDPDGDALTYSATGLPAGLSINATTGLISGTIDYSASTSSPHAVTITVTDGTLQAQDTFSWTVTNTDRPPIFNQPAVDQSNAEGDLIGLSAAATDQDGDPITYAATGLPVGLSINPATGLISGTIDYSASAANPYAVTVTASDGTLSATEAFQWTVSNTNRAPLLSLLSDQSGAEGDSINLSLNAAATDPDGDALTFAATGLPAGLSMNSTGVISGNISYNSASSTPYTVTVKVSDGSLSAQSTFYWSVSNTNRAPTFNHVIADQSARELQNISITASASDPDNNPITYTASGLPANLSINSSTGVISGQLASGSSRATPYVVTVTASDGSLSVSQSFNMTVQAREAVIAGGASCDATGNPDPSSMLTLVAMLLLGLAGLKRRVKRSTLNVPGSS